MIEKRIKIPQVCRSHNQEAKCQCLTCNYMYLCIFCMQVHDSTHKFVNFHEDSNSANVAFYLRKEENYDKMKSLMEKHHFIIQISGSIHDNEDFRSFDSRSPSRSSDSRSGSEMYFEDSTGKIKLFDVNDRKIYENRYDHYKLCNVKSSLLMNNLLFFDAEIEATSFGVHDLIRFTTIFRIDLAKFPAEVKELARMPFRKYVNNIIHYNHFLYFAGWEYNRINKAGCLKYDIKNNKWFILPRLFKKSEIISTYDDIKKYNATTCFYNNRTIYCLGKKCWFFDILDEEAGWNSKEINIKTARKILEFESVIQVSNKTLYCFIDGHLYELKIDKKIKFHKINLHILRVNGLTKKVYIKNKNLWILSSDNWRKNAFDFIYYINLKTRKLKELDIFPQST